LGIALPLHYVDEESELQRARRLETGRNREEEVT